ncbi:MAG: hypothetical protein ACYCQI_08690 [Gammaproteobacteria bacterium]
MRTRLYAVARWIKTTDRTADLQNLVLNAANELYTKRESLRLYQSWDDVIKYVIERKATHHHKRNEEPIIVELIVDPRNKEEWNTEVRDLEQSQIPFNYVPNKPENYIIHNAWLDNKRYSVHTLAVPKTYNAIFFEKENWSVIGAIRELFRDYHSPKFFSCHWRHHKQQAREITNALSRKITPAQVNELLFTIRAQVMTAPKTNISGSFVRRIDFALVKLRDTVGDDLDKTSSMKLDISAAKI